MSQKPPAVVYRNPKKEVHREWYFDDFLFNTTAYTMDLYTATDKCTIMGYELEIVMVNHENTPTEDERYNEWVLYVSSHASDVRTPPTDGGSGAMDKQVIDAGRQPLVDAQIITDTYEKKSRQKRKMNKGDILKLTAKQNATDVKCRIYVKAFIYIGT